MLQVLIRVFSHTHLIRCRYLVHIVAGREGRQVALRDVLQRRLASGNVHILAVDGPIRPLHAIPLP